RSQMPYTRRQDFVVVRPSSHLNRRIARAFGVACVTVCAVAAFAVPSASAAVPCWKTLLNDWYDGHIDHVYPIPCYHQAIKHLPLDVKEYSNAGQDIQRALAQAIANKTQQAVTTTIGGTTTTVQPGPATPPSTTTTATKKRSPFSNAIRKITPGGADAFPLPLLIL